jgi:hypothetical protein
MAILTTFPSDKQDRRPSANWLMAMANNVLNPDLLAAAREYLAAGLCPLPAIRLEKRPALAAWKSYQLQLPTTAELDAWFGNGCDAVCLVAGSVSGNLELLDFDRGGELFDAWAAKISTEMLAKLVVETSQSGGKHVIYRCVTPVSGNLKLAQGRRDGQPVTLIETRGEGGLFLCAPTDGYRLTQGTFSNIPVLTDAERDLLLEAAWSLNESVPEPAEYAPTYSSPSDKRPGDDYNARGDVRALLIKAGWTLARPGENEFWRRPGKDRGWSSTLRDRVFYVFSSNAAPFEPNRAYSPFAVYALLEHQGDFAQAASALRAEGFGDDGVVGGATDVDISALVASVVTSPEKAVPAVSDPGPIPEELFRVPGFIADVMDVTLGNAPYPNVALAFCGAMALQSFLAGRKVCTPGDLRSNIYLLALASSGAGKDFPRKVNSRVLFEVGLVGAIGDKFASGEGIQDALVRTNAMLFQNDEMDDVLRQINFDRDNRRESIPNILLTLYTSANDVYPIRVKAGQKESIQIDQPHLTLFGTATPQCFYESLSQRMLTNGFFARMMIVDVGKRGPGQTPGSARRVPKSIIETARWWADFQPGAGNLRETYPEPRVVQFEPDAAEAVTQLQRMAEAEYDRAEEAKDEVARTAWSRTCENATKLALLYACSESYQNPVISLAAVQWATQFAMLQTRRQLFLAATYVAENPFHAECLKLLRKLSETPDRQLQRQYLLRAMRCKAADFDQIVNTLLQQGDIVSVQIPTKTKPAQGYRLA